jgi:hypothetical protein
MVSKRGWLPFIGYVALVGAFLLPSGTRLSRDLLGSPGGDSLESLWNAWWLSQSLLRLENPWWTDLLFAPEGTPLVWHSLAVLPSTAVALLSSALPLPLAYNAVMLAALPVAGLGGFLLCRHLTSDAAASFAGGAAFMLCPFVVSKTLGHLDLAYAGLLPFFYLALLRCLSEDGGRLRLAAASLLLVFASSPNTPIFAANLAFFLFCRQARRESWARATRRFARVFTPTLLLALPYLVLVLYYAIAYDYPPRVQRDLDYDPELIAYLLPFTPTSAYSDLPRSFGLAGLDGVEPAVYLGIGVLPIAVAGLVLRRRERLVAHLALVGAVFFVFSMGPKLLWEREVVEISGWTVYLPFGLWRWAPVLGSVGQAGRYAVIVYLVMAVGTAHAVAWVRERHGDRLGLAAAGIVVAIIAADFAFRPIFGELPAPLQLSAAAPDRIRVLDPRLGSAETMYQQTLHGRSLVGGYISRPRLPIVERYARDPVLGWLFGAEPAPEKGELIARLRELAVGDVLLDPDDPRGTVLALAGFVRRSGSRHTAVWSRPE